MDPRDTCVVDQFSIITVLDAVFIFYEGVNVNAKVDI